MFFSFANFFPNVISPSLEQQLARKEISVDCQCLHESLPLLILCWKKVFSVTRISSCCKSCDFLGCCWTLLQQFWKCYNLSWIVVYV